MKKILILVIIIAGAATFLELFVLRKNSERPIPQTQNNVSNQQSAEIANSMASVIADTPTATNSEPAPAPDPVATNPLPIKFLLPIPFYSQAPLSKWDAVHEEMCEESSVLNAGLYLLDKKMTAEAFEKELMAFKKIEEKELGDYKSNTIAEIKKVTDIYFEGKIKTKIIENPTIDDIEAEIAAGLPADEAGHPVVVPLAGRDIGNPNFTPPGPVYHMLVVKGYDTQNFITNDVGTRKGESYIYTKDVIMKNIHDWNPQDIHLGAKMVLSLYK
jgi:hypothetical protein